VVLASLGLVVPIALALTAGGCSRARKNPFDPGSPEFIPPPVIDRVLWEFRDHTAIDSLVAEVFFEESVEKPTPIDNAMYFPGRPPGSRTVTVPVGGFSYAVYVDSTALPSGPYRLEVSYGGEVLADTTYWLTVPPILVRQKTPFRLSVLPSSPLPMH
jgi:hypothetical protein